MSRMHSPYQARITIETEERTITYVVSDFSLDLRHHAVPVDLSSGMSYMQGPQTGELRFTLIPGLGDVKDNASTQLLENYLKLIGAMPE
jgi:hypothetical protein